MRSTETKQNGKIFISTARLASYKRVDLIIKAFLELPEKRLILSSAGPEESYLKQLAKGFNNIHFTGDVNEQELQQLVGNAIATIYTPKDEDFGMSPIKSMSAGKLLIGASEGGPFINLGSWKTGWLKTLNPSPEELIQAIKEINSKQALSMQNKCEK